MLLRRSELDIQWQPSSLQIANQEGYPWSRDPSIGIPGPADLQEHSSNSILCFYQLQDSAPLQALHILSDLLNLPCPFS